MKEVRPCEMYQDEYEECTSFRARWNQKYIFGEEMNCSKWQENFINCIKLRETQDITYAEKIIENERERMAEREKQQQTNDVWEYRTQPPAEWAAPLPAALTKHGVPSNIKDALDHTEKNKQTCLIS